MHRDIHRAHAEQKTGTHMRIRCEAFAVEKPYSGENHRPYDQHGDYILRQRMLLLWGQLERRPILQPNRHSRATLRPAHERLAGQDRLIWQDDRSRLRLGEAVFWRDHSLRARQAHGCFLLVLAMPHKAAPTPWALQRGDHPQKLSLFLSLALLAPYINAMKSSGGDVNFLFYSISPPWLCP